MQLSALRRKWCDRAIRLTHGLSRPAGRWTVDDLRFVCRTIGQPHHLNWWGILMACLRNRGLVRRVGYRRSGRPEANGRTVSVWVFEKP